MLTRIRKLIGDLHYILHVRDRQLLTYMMPEEKRSFLRSFATDYNTFIETGTYLGETTAAMAQCYSMVHTIEIDENLYNKAAARFERFSNVTCHFGNSTYILPKILDGLTEPAIFWLDGHYSGGVTGRATNCMTPIEQELVHIFQHDSRRHLVLIDDARLFVGRRHSYPSLGRLACLVRGQSHYNINIKDDIIRVFPDAEWIL